MAVELGAGLSMNVDVLGIGQAIASKVNADQNREGFVKNLMETSFHEAGGNYNVMVFNLSQDYEERFTGVQLYGSATYGDVVYGIWVFEEGEFTKKGDGGWINWAFKGFFDRNGDYVKFHKH